MINENYYHSQVFAILIWEGPTNGRGRAPDEGIRRIAPPAVPCGDDLSR